MDIAIVHYHLNRGGVAQVILNHLAALHASTPQGETRRVLLITGGRREGWPAHRAAKWSRLEIEFADLPELEYDELHATSADPHALARQLRSALQSRGMAGESTLVHVHNHALGKNLSLPGAVGHLADEGFRLLLQIHDFAEDFRPANYRRLMESLADADGAGNPAAWLYPQASHIHYAVLNSRDQSVLSGAGVPSDRLHVLPNPVEELGMLPDAAAARKKLERLFGVPTDASFIVYPVRGIRRKNLGEALFWSQLAASIGGRRNAWFGFTLPPLNPLEQPAYRFWKEAASDLRLPCVFEIGATDGLLFAEVLAAADKLLTTSVAEGFGMVFLESWLAGRPLVGRDLPEITADFRRQGLRLEHLGRSLCVPVVRTVGADRFVASFVESYRRVLGEYGRPESSAETLQAQVERLIGDGEVDFAYLPRALQRDVLQAVADSASLAEAVVAANPWMRSALESSPEELAATIAHNAECVRRYYSVEECGRRLLRIYADVLTGEPSQVSGLADAERILHWFLDVTRFHPLRVEP